MMREDFLQQESSQLQHYQTLEHEQRRINIGQITSVELANKAGCKITKDGNKWCCLWGEDLQVGIAGFGDNPLDAISAWASEFGMF